MYLQVGKKRSSKFKVFNFSEHFSAQPIILKEDFLAFWDEQEAYG